MPAVLFVCNKRLQIRDKIFTKYAIKYYTTKIWTYLQISLHSQSIKFKYIKYHGVGREGVIKQLGKAQRDIGRMFHFVNNPPGDGAP